MIARLVVLCLLLAPGAATAAERYAVIISGAAGGEKYATQLRKWREDLTGTLLGPLGMPESNLVVLDAERAGTSSPTAANVRRLFDDLKRRTMPDDTILLVLLGHGTFDGADAKFNLVGPDLTGAEWKAMLAGLAGRLALVNTTESSFPFIEQLSQKGRVVVTATDSATQRYATVFPEFFVLALGDPSSDYDRNGRISIWEAFAAASTRVRQYYEQRGQLSTERPLVDDDGDRVGREAEAPGPDGSLARSFFLDGESGSARGLDPQLAELLRERQSIEKRFDELKQRRPLLSDDQYQAEMEQLLIELSRIAQRIRQRS